MLCGEDCKAGSGCCWVVDDCCEESDFSILFILSGINYIQNFRVFVEGSRFCFY